MRTSFFVVTGMTLVDLMSRFSDEDCCRELLERLRWPIAPKCIRCGKDVSRRGAILICYACHYEFRVTTGTIFGDTKLPLETWFLAVLLLCEARKGISANQLKRTIGRELQNCVVLVPIAFASQWRQRSVRP